jgi:hypothetical protein
MQKDEKCFVEKITLFVCKIARGLDKKSDRLELVLFLRNLFEYGEYQLNRKNGSAVFRYTAPHFRLVAEICGEIWQEEDHVCLQGGWGLEEIHQP